MTNTPTKKGAVKGTVAAAAGVAVLLGGAGTFALWNTSGAIGTGNLATGELTADIGAITWDDVTPGHENTGIVINDFQMVPGDTLVGTSTITVTAQGENIVVDPKITDAAGADYVTSLPAALQDDMTIDVALTGDAITNGQITAGTDQAITATITVQYEGTTADQNSGQKQTISLDNLRLELVQVLPGQQG